MKKPSQKDNFPTDSIETENSCELFSMVSNIAQQLKTMFDYVVGDCVAVSYGNQWFAGVIEEELKYCIFCFASIS